MTNSNQNNFFTPIGYRGEENFVFSKIRNCLLTLSASSFSKSSLLNSFGLEFLKNFPKFNEKGKIVGYDTDAIQEMIMSQCIEAGMFDTTKKLNGYGVFKHPSKKGHLIINTDKIWSTDESFDGDRVIDGYVFNNDKDLYINENTEEVSAEEAKFLRKLYSTWNFKRGVQDENFLLGWIACSPFVGVLDWSTHCCLTGDAGTGKSTIQNLNQNIIGELGYLFDGDSTEAGLRQSLRGASAILLIDESESNSGKMAGHLKMARSASSGSIKALGTTDQKGIQFKLKFSMMLTGIVAPAMSQEDESRFLKLELLERNTSSSDVSMKMFLADNKKQKQLGVKVAKFMINHYTNLLKIDVAVKNILAQNGASDRFLATYGTIIASSFMMNNIDWFKNKDQERHVDVDTLFDLEDACSVFDAEMKELSKEEMKIYEDNKDYFDYIALKDFVLSFDLKAEKEQNGLKNHEALFNIILGTQLKSDKLTKRNILNYIFDYQDGFSKADIKSLLGEFGMRTDVEANGESSLYIDTLDTNFIKLLKDTKFATGDSKIVLSRLQDAVEVKDTVQIGGIRRSRKGVIKINIDSLKYKRDN